MGKVAWFITHDDYIDRRIFFFVEVLEEQGYQVKLFPSFYMNALSAYDAPYIKRPVTEKIVRDYNVSMSELTDEERLIIDAIKKESIFIKNKGRYSNNVKTLLRNLEMNDYVKIGVHEGQYCVEIAQDNYTLCYNSVTDSICRIIPTNWIVEVKKCEKAIVEILNDASIEKEQVVNKEDMVLMRHTNADDENYIYVTMPILGIMFIYNEECESLTEVTPYLYSWEKDVVCGKEYDFIEYKKVIYNYSPIMCRINEELEIEKPDVVYVADLPTLPMGVMLKETVGCKLIVDCHEWWYKQTILWEEENHEKIKMVDEFEALLYPKCDLRITVGENLAKRMEGYYHCSFEVIYSCMSQKLSTHKIIDKKFLTQKYGIPENSKIAIFQGGMSTFRNLENLARATKYLEEDSYLLLLTTGVYQEEFKKILHNEGNPNRVIWGGWIKQDELLNYTQNVDVGVIPYTAVNDYSECFVPNKLMEYFEVKLPIFYDSSMFELSLVAGGNHVGYGSDLKNAEKFGIELNALLHDSQRIADLKKSYEVCGGKFEYDSQRRVFEHLLTDYKI